MGAAPAARPEPLTDIEYKLLLVAYVHSQPDDGLRKGKVISTLFAAAGPVGNNPASLPQLLTELGAASVGELEVSVNEFALSARRNLLAALKKTRASILNALPPDFPAGSKEEADVAVKPILGAVARKVQALQEAARARAEAATPEEAAAAPPAPVQVRAMIWQPPIKFTRADKLGGGDASKLQLLTPFDGDLVLGAGALMYRIQVEDAAVRFQHYEMYGEHRAGEDAVYPVGHRIVIGRGSRADHRRPEQEADPGSRGLSRMHVAVTVHRVPGQGTLAIQLEDLGSTNGTPVWWNGPQGAPPVPMKEQVELKRIGARDSLDVAFDGDAWLAAGSLLYRIQIAGDAIRVTHHGVDVPGVEGESRAHAIGTAFTIGRDAACEHSVPAAHPGSTGLSRRHATVKVHPGASAWQLEIVDHSSNGTTVWWNPPRTGS